MNEIKKQVVFCYTMAEKLTEQVAKHEEIRKSSPGAFHSDLNMHGPAKINGACKCQIQNDIVRLRRELDTLSRMLED